MRIVPSDVVRFMEDQKDSFPLFDPANTGLNAQIDRTHLTLVAGVVRLIEAIPDELLALAGSDRTAFFFALEHTRTVVTRWMSNDVSGIILRSPPSGPPTPHPLKVLQNLLSKCPDEIAPDTAPTLPFLSGSADFQRDLRRDIASVEAAILAREWKTATVIGGSVIEALLLWSLEAADTKTAGLLGKLQPLVKPKHPPVREWDLGELAKGAEHMNLIVGADSVQINAARSFRNLIHPGRVERVGVRCGPDTSHAVMAAIFLVIRKIEENLGTLL
jgi:hypothetical protein